MTNELKRSRRSTVVITLGWVLAGVLTVDATWSGGIAIEMMLVIMTGLGAVFGDTVLPFQISWIGTIHHGVAAALAMFVAWRTIRYQRLTRGACRSCGRGQGPGRNLHRLAVKAAYVSIFPAVGYGALKVYWAFGGTFGLHDKSMFADVKPWTPGFTDTAIEAGIGIVIVMLMIRPQLSIPRWILLGPALIGCVMLVPMSIIGTASNVWHAFVQEQSPMTLQPWVTWYVYGCFTIWGVALLIVTTYYYSHTRKACASCEPGMSGSQP